MSAIAPHPPPTPFGGFAAAGSGAGGDDDGNDPRWNQVRPTHAVDADPDSSSSDDDDDDEEEEEEDSDSVSGEDDGSPWLCLVCRAKLQTANILRAHMRSHRTSPSNPGPAPSKPPLPKPPQAVKNPGPPLPPKPPRPPKPLLPQPEQHRLHGFSIPNPGGRGQRVLPGKKPFPGCPGDGGQEGENDATSPSSPKRAKKSSVTFDIAVRQLAEALPPHEGGWIPSNPPPGESAQAAQHPTPSHGIEDRREVDQTVELRRSMARLSLNPRCKKKLDLSEDTDG